MKESRRISLPKGSKKRKPKSPAKPDLPLIDEQLDKFYDDLVRNPPKTRKFLRNLPELVPKATETETEEDSPAKLTYDHDAGSVLGTPEASLQDSESEDAYKPDDVVAVDPQGSGRKKA